MPVTAAEAVDRELLYIVFLPCPPQQQQQQQQQQQTTNKKATNNNNNDDDDDNNNNNNDNNNEPSSCVLCSCMTLPFSAISEEICAMMGKRCLHSAPLHLIDGGSAQGDSTSGTNMDRIKFELLVGELFSL